MNSDDVRSGLADDQTLSPEEYADLVEAQELADEFAQLVTEHRGDAAVDLTCGHFTEAGPTARFSNGRKLYTCPHGCGLQDERR